MEQNQLKEALRLGLISNAYVMNATGLGAVNISNYKKDLNRMMKKENFKKFQDRLNKDGFKIEKI